MRIFKSHPLLSLVNGYLVDSPQPSNISYLWNFGSLLGFCLVIQIITGVTLAMHYNPSVLEAFNSVEHIMRDVNNGWLIRYLHSNTASAFFFIVYLHIGRGLYYGSYRAPSAPYFMFKDLITIFWYIVLLFIIVFLMPYVLGDSENYVMANTMLFTNPRSNIVILNYQIRGVRFITSSNICRTCDSSDGENIDNTESIISQCPSETDVLAYYEKKFDNIGEDMEMWSKLYDQKEKVLSIMNDRKLRSDQADQVLGTDQADQVLGTDQADQVLGSYNTSNVKNWLDGVDSENLGDPNKSDNSGNSSNSNDSTRLPQDSSDVTQTEFNSFEPFDE